MKLIDTKDWKAVHFKDGSSVRPMFIAPVITWMITMLSFPRWMKQS